MSLSGSSSGKLPKENPYSTAKLKPQSLFEGWATKQGGGNRSKNWKKRYFLLLPAFNNPKGAELFYFKSDKAATALGIIGLSATSVVKELSIKGKSCFVIESGLVGTRTYILYCSTSAEQQLFLKALNDRVYALKNKPTTKVETVMLSTMNKTQGATVNQNQGLMTTVNSTTMEGNMVKSPTIITSPSSASAPGSSKNKYGIKSIYEKVRALIPLLVDGNSEHRVNEFMQIWMDSIPDSALIEGDGITSVLVSNSDMSQLSWRVHGPQNLLIQEMVDFFWNVGAPEPEIDRLNEIGSIITPQYIGSWIEMSSKGGMDGGWVFPVEVDFDNALSACDECSSLQEFKEWAKSNGIDQCFTVGRDMGASPPRQTELRMHIHGSTFEEKLQKVVKSYKELGFPALSESYLAILKHWKPSTVDLSVINSTDGFVRIGVILSEPDSNIMLEIAKVAEYNINELLEFQKKMKITHPASIEFQFLNEGYGYGVYNEGFHIVFHYALEKIKL